MTDDDTSTTELVFDGIEWVYGPHESPWVSSITYDVNPSFVLMDIDTLHVVVYVYELIDAKGNPWQVLLPAPNRISSKSRPTSIFESQILSGLKSKETENLKMRAIKKIAQSGPINKGGSGMVGTSIVPVNHASVVSTGIGSPQVVTPVKERLVNWNDNVLKSAPRSKQSWENEQKKSYVDGEGSTNTDLVHELEVQDQATVKQNEKEAGPSKAPDKKQRAKVGANKIVQKASSSSMALGVLGKKNYAQALILKDFLSDSTEYELSTRD
ncbi:hypothetical protein RND71_019622 [Anisodus tanguticus]|uniref:Uncharacterized protein n=1 Tax=Anisodus tanguticus TaxID=243964 RepID=A0AAE1VHL3_9SOLA|nr:hypothetical protein RND71_019622 [Anisodus tanguticus]